MFGVRWNPLLKISAYLLCPAIAGLVGCSSPVKPLDSSSQQVVDGLTIQTEKTEYTWAEVSQAGIRATVVNRTDDDFYGTLGDGYNADAEQAILYIAQGSDAFVEKWPAWTSLQRSYLFEGVKVVVLRPRGTYTLFGHFPGPRVSGRFRVRVQYFDQMDIEPGGVAHQAFSNTFVIR